MTAKEVQLKCQVAHAKLLCVIVTPSSTQETGGNLWPLANAAGMAVGIDMLSFCTNLEPLDVGFRMGVGRSAAGGWIKALHLRRSVGINMERAASGVRLGTCTLHFRCYDYDGWGA